MKFTEEITLDGKEYIAEGECKVWSKRWSECPGGDRSIKVNCSEITDYEIELESVFDDDHQELVLSKELTSRVKTILVSHTDVLEYCDV